ncbi:hypothetical protein AB1N83_008191 [Pleurotus pulmonarius]
MSITVRCLTKQNKCMGRRVMEYNINKRIQSQNVPLAPRLFASSSRRQLVSHLDVCASAVRTLSADKKVSGPGGGLRGTPPSSLRGRGPVDDIGRCPSARVSSKSSSRWRGVLYDFRPLPLQCVRSSKLSSRGWDVLCNLCRLPLKRVRSPKLGREWGILYNFCRLPLQYVRSSKLSDRGWGVLRNFCRLPFQCVRSSKLSGRDRGVLYYFRLLALQCVRPSKLASWGCCGWGVLYNLCRLPLQCPLSSKPSSWGWGVLCNLCRLPLQCPRSSKLSSREWGVLYDFRPLPLQCVRSTRFWTLCVFLLDICVALYIGISSFGHVGIPTFILIFFGGQEHDFLTQRRLRGGRHSSTTPRLSALPIGLDDNPSQRHLPLLLEPLRLGPLLPPAEESPQCMRASRREAPRHIVRPDEGDPPCGRAGDALRQLAVLAHPPGFDIGVLEWSAGDSFGGSVGHLAVGALYWRPVLGVVRGEVVGVEGRFSVVGVVRGVGVGGGCLRLLSSSRVARRPWTSDREVRTIVGTINPGDETVDKHKQ